MKKFTLLLSLLFTIVSIQAQDYLISFAGTGASTTVGTVTVENLTQGKSISLLGSEVLHLSGTWNGINTISNSENVLCIYPNPTTENSTIGFVATASGITNVELFDITGKRLGAIQNTLTIGTHSYQLSGLRSGIYTVRVSSQAYTYTGKLVSNGAPNSAVKICYLGNSVFPITPKLLKSASAEKLMQYNTGDRLKFIGNTDNYSTITTDIPNQSKTITFPFVACTDGDGNNYTVVQIGSQLWMAENLKTTKYRDGSQIPNVTDNTSWGNLTTGAHCNYNNDAAIGIKYGKLYNWYAVNDSRKIAPTGWHVASDAEWTTLENYLIANGYNYDGATTGNKIAKSLAATTDWDSYTDTGTIGNYLTKNNSSGFTALPGGGRGDGGAFGDIGGGGYWWSSTELDATNAWGKGLFSDDGGLGRNYIPKSAGFSVRCVCYTGDSPLVTTDFSINLSSNPPAGGTTDGGGAYSAGTSVTVIASKNTGYNFVNWTDKLNGTEVSTNSNYQFIMPANNRTLVANFTAVLPNTFTLTVNATNGTVTKAPDLVFYPSGSNVTLTPSANPGYKFDSWGGDATGSVNPLTVTMNSDKNITANFTQQFAIFLSSNPLLGGTTSGGGSFNSGTLVTVTAVANVGYTFTYWTEGANIVSTNSSYTFTMPAGNRTFVANFTAVLPNTFTLTVNATNGSVLKNPDLVFYLSGTIVQLTATPNPGYTFASWGGDATGTNPSVTVIMNSDKNVTANFNY